MVDISDEVTTLSATTAEQLLLAMWLKCVRGGDQPDLFVVNNTTYKFYELSQVALKRYTDKDNVDGGFGGLKYKNATVVFDSDGGIADNINYALNTDYLKLRVHKDANLSVLDEAKPFNQDAAVIPILWMGNLTCSNRSLQCVTKA